MRARTLVVATLMLAGSLGAHAATALDGRLIRGLDLVPTIATETPPPLALRRLDDGRTQTLEQLRGRPVLVYFWATW
jgi:hypothetical protein